jgi:hypothetical protein
MKEVCLLLVAILLLYILFPIIIIFMVIKFILTGDKRMMLVWFYRTAREIDVFANINCGEFFNSIFLTEGGYKFGKQNETISSVIGKNQRSNTLSIAGMILRKILDYIDEDHCKKSIRDDISNTHKNTQ